MLVVIGGYGRVGRYLAHMLEAGGHSVAVIDRDVGVFDQPGPGFSGRKLAGEVFDRATLIKAGIERADAYAAVTSGDNSNMVSARIAKERFNVPRVVARIYDPRRAIIYEGLGIPTISSVQWESGIFLATIVEPSLQAISVWGSGEVVTISAVAGTTLSGKRVGDVDYPNKFHITTLVRDGVALIAEPRLELKHGDRLGITVTREALPELKQLLDVEQG